MSLTALWLNNKDQIQGKRVQQVIGFAGDGKLRDGGSASKEFREFLAHIPSALLEKYASECLGDEKFADNGCALQDIVNEVGRRIGYKANSGLYRGKVNEVGHDGLWESDDGWAIVVEVKATDVYSINLDTIATYRKKLINARKLMEETSSILLVVGRSDTGSLEAQVRGSRHAWDIRLISVEALLNLMKVKEALDRPQTIEKIRAVLTPKEFTKLDAIVDLVFSTAADAQLESEESEVETLTKSTPRSEPVAFRDLCVERIQASLRTPLVRRSKAFYSSADEKTGVCIIISQRYDYSTAHFWFAFHPHQLADLESVQTAYLALGCGSAENILLIPLKSFRPLLSTLHKTSDEKRGTYWHVKIKLEDGRFILRPKSGSEAVELTEFVVKKGTKGS